MESLLEGFNEILAWPRVTLNENIPVNNGDVKWKGLSCFLLVSKWVLCFFRMSRRLNPALVPGAPGASSCH